MGKEIFKNIPSKVKDLVSDVRNGKIGLPDLQRPFVWEDAKVRDLFDSMLRGYPIGYIMLWESPLNYEEKKHSIGKNDKTYEEPKELVIDGQQRLTALVASMYGVPVKDKNYNNRTIKISYNPLAREFAVWTSAYEKNTEWINQITDVFVAKENNSIGKLRRDYIKSLNEARTKKGEAELTDDEEQLIEDNINALLNLEDYSLPTLEISATADEQDVADIFVRVNSGGQKLNENNFIETLIAVYEKKVHDNIDDFCKKSRVPASNTSFNNILEVDPSHLIRVAVTLGFHRARLRYAYMLLRGKNLKTGKFSDEERIKNLDLFKDALEKVMDLNNWHAFFNIIKSAGYVSRKLIASSNAVVYSYALYLIGKYDYGLEPLKLRNIISRWFFMAAITYYYTGSYESVVERQLADLKDIETKEGFVDYLEKTIAGIFTEDYFNITLLNDFNTSSANSPIWFAYLASQIVLNTPMLFSTNNLAMFYLPGASGTKNAIDKHHIFPKHFLTENGVKSDRDRNQIANFAYIDYQTNIEISDDPPSEYVPRYKAKYSESDFYTHCTNNALPVDFENMDYFDFLDSRRALMVQLVKKAYLKLCENNERF